MALFPLDYMPFSKGRCMSLLPKAHWLRCQCLPTLPYAFHRSFPHSGLPYSFSQPRLLSIPPQCLRIFLPLHFCFQDFLISCPNPTAAAPAPKFPQHSLCTAGFPSLLCFTVMRLPVWLSLSILKSLRLETSNDSSQRYCLH